MDTGTRTEVQLEKKKTILSQLVRVSALCQHSQVHVQVFEETVSLKDICHYLKGKTSFSVFKKPCKDVSSSRPCTHFLFCSKWSPGFSSRPLLFGGSWLVCPHSESHPDWQRTCFKPQLQAFSFKLLFSIAIAFPSQVQLRFAGVSVEWCEAHKP